MECALAFLACAERVRKGLAGQIARVEEVELPRSPERG